MNGRWWNSSNKILVWHRWRFVNWNDNLIHILSNYYFLLLNYLFFMNLYCLWLSIQISLDSLFNFRLLMSIGNCYILKFRRIWMVLFLFYFCLSGELRNLMNLCFCWFNDHWFCACSLWIFWTSHFDSLDFNIFWNCVRWICLFRSISNQTIAP